ncbi:hypothetical protein FF38_06930 [Lucilia cuprina]|uniref:Uncharacterized protein n=1 Tax=Lucilia cuprina TaxID=7375 RepID=A0A0L0CDB0_LUCCU|nr:hypothetical protein FF38_06930 [Lucilia cuprina]
MNISCNKIHEIKHIESKFFYELLLNERIAVKYFPFKKTNGKTLFCKKRPYVCLTFRVFIPTIKNIGEAYIDFVIPFSTHRDTTIQHRFIILNHYFNTLVILGTSTYSARLQIGSKFHSHSSVVSATPPNLSLNIDFTLHQSFNRNLLFPRRKPIQLPSKDKVLRATDNLVNLSTKFKKNNNN